MDSEDYEELKPSEVVERIAKACGWKDIHIVGNGIIEFGPRGIDPNGDPNNNEIPIPNYLKDLNAMHTAEMVMIKVDEENDDHHFWYLYEDWLEGLSEDNSSVTATAEKRAEAFVCGVSEELLSKLEREADD